MRHMSSYVSINTLDQMYKMFFRLHLDYCDVIYHIPPSQEFGTSNFSLHYLMKNIESTEYQAACAVTGAWKGTNTIKLYEELGWQSLSDRRVHRRLVQFYKIYNDNNTPSYLKSLIPESVTLNYGKRRENVLHEFKCRTQTFANTFFPDGVQKWNEIGVEYRTIESFSKFKNHLKSCIPSRKSTFGIHYPIIGIKRLFQLRLSLSPLKKHKFDHKFSDTLSNVCECGTAPEDSLHFFLICPLFSAQRASLIELISNTLSQKGIQNLKLKDLLHTVLYGHPKLNNEENRSIIKATITCIERENMH